jgi:hypothetical protein
MILLPFFNDCWIVMSARRFLMWLHCKTLGPRMPGGQLAIGLAILLCQA